MEKTKNNVVMIDNGVKCCNCNSEMNFKMPIDAMLFVKYSEAFLLLHQHCSPKKNTLKINVLSFLHKLFTFLRK